MKSVFTLEVQLDNWAVKEKKREALEREVAERVRKRVEDAERRNRSERE